ncbi:hypothetical protein [Flavobacterium sp. MMS24-S5]|uniref:hypothetical protein n=1 Tax=Flavobacterium sp. MMS24-S5 TaxID=3416605 RepID=UPI003D01F417
MSTDEKEKNGQEDQYFQNDRRQYEDPDIDSPPADHSLTENPEPDYGTNLALNEEDDRSDDDESQDEDNDLDEDEDIEEERDTYDKE